MCGEQKNLRTNAGISKGSPPRVRGTGPDKDLRNIGAGITPACAGNRFHAFFPIAPIQDHPRVCGEQKPVRLWPFRQEGSPPRVRGTVIPVAFATQLPRITPACAGNRGCVSAQRRYHPDHPRVCGEQPNIDICILFHAGSPPRVRGTVSRAGAILLDIRITPACAGNSFVNIFNAIAERDHPRVCGEQGTMQEVTQNALGSPPRVRGTVHADNLVFLIIRITPACAGNSILTPQMKYMRQDHPRVCGEQRIIPLIKAIAAGSPPRVRGTVASPLL